MPASQERSRGATASRASVSLSSQTKVLPVRCAAGSAMRSPMDAMSPPESRALLPLKVTVSAREYSWFTGTARRGGCQPVAASMPPGRIIRHAGLQRFLRWGSLYALHP